MQSEGKPEYTNNYFQNTVENIFKEQKVAEHNSAF